MRIKHGRLVLCQAISKGHASSCRALPPPPTAKRRKELALQLGVSEPYLYQCLTGRRSMDPGQARSLEDASQGELRRELLCQHTYAAIWPELAA